MLYIYSVWNLIAPHGHLATILDDNQATCINSTLILHISKTKPKTIPNQVDAKHIAACFRGLSFVCHLSHFDDCFFEINM